MAELRINDELVIGDGHPVWIVAEIGLCHNGDFDLAKTMIQKCAEKGASAVKFQKRDVDNLAIASVLDAEDKRFPSFGKTYREVRRHIEFDLHQLRDLQGCAYEAGLPMHASVFDVKSAEQMAELNMPVMKVASHCMSHRPLIDCLCDLKIPSILSTGMATWEEIDETVELLTKANTPFGLYHCVSDYPHTYETANLKFITKLKERYGVPVGYSSHELDNESAFLSVALGAFSIEKHVTLDRKMEGFDHKIAQDMDGLENLVQGIRRAEVALGDGEKFVSENEWVTRKKYHSSIVPITEIAEGTEITADMLTVKNPSGGIPAREFHGVVGKRAKKALSIDELVTWEMLEG